MKYLLLIPIPDFLRVVHERLYVELPLKPVHEGDRVVLDLLAVDHVQLARLVLGAIV